jgi:hypothetical protein
MARDEMVPPLAPDKEEKKKIEDHEEDAQQMIISSCCPCCWENKNLLSLGLGGFPEFWQRTVVDINGVSTRALVTISC